MRTVGTRRWAGVVAVLLGPALVACQPVGGNPPPVSTYAASWEKAVAAGSTPWFCRAPAANQGGAHDHVDPLYAGTVKGDLAADDCGALAGQFDRALAFAQQYPDDETARKNRWYELVPYLKGLGTHLIHDIPGPDEFDPARPNLLLYEGKGADAKLVGMTWVVLNDGKSAPPGFAGGNDWWHRHTDVCIGGLPPHVMAEFTTTLSCLLRLGLLIDASGLWFLHAWIVPGWEHLPDVFDGHHPCLGATGTLPPDDGCWAVAAGTAEPAPVSPAPSGTGEHSHG